jgi:hypothetical protein
MPEKNSYSPERRDATFPTLQVPLALEERFSNTNPAWWGGGGGGGDLRKISHKCQFSVCVYVKLDILASLTPAGKVGCSVPLQFIYLIEPGSPAG